KETGNFQTTPTGHHRARRDEIFKKQLFYSVRNIPWQTRPLKAFPGGEQRRLKNTTTCRLDFFLISKQESNIEVLRHEIQLSFQLLRQPDVVGIEKADKLSRCGLDTRIPGG